MLHKRRFDPLIDLPADPLPNSTWVRIARLLGLSGKARTDFERLWVAHRFLANAEREDYELAYGLMLFNLQAELNWGLVEGQQFSRDYVERMHQFFEETMQHIQKMRKARPSRVHRLVQSLVQLIKRDTGKRVHHGDKWIGALTEVCQKIDPEITQSKVREVLHPRRPRRN